ncbi:hypothetical protein LTR12_008635 [Friedmanniomyces endolithicus]|nr:hypothetical protein LTR12_008635 [Friedmanniomyces endolithicus]
MAIITREMQQEVKNLFESSDVQYIASIEIESSSLGSWPADLKRGARTLAGDQQEGDVVKDFM